MLWIRRHTYIFDFRPFSAIFTSLCIRPPYCQGDTRLRTGHDGICHVVWTWQRIIYLIWYAYLNQDVRYHNMKDGKDKKFATETNGTYSTVNSLYETFLLWMTFLLRLLPKGSFNKDTALVQIIPGWRTGDKRWTNLLTHICTTGTRCYHCWRITLFRNVILRFLISNLLEERTQVKDYSRNIIIEWMSL